MAIFTVKYMNHRGNISVSNGKVTFMCLLSYVLVGHLHRLYTQCMLTEKVACYVRKVTIAPLLTWIDDNWGANAVSSKFLPACDQLSSARRVCYVTLMIMFHAGYFVNINKSVLEPHTLVRHLGIMVHSGENFFFVPQDRVDDLVHEYH